MNNLACPPNTSINDNITYNNATNFIETKNNITSISTIANTSNITYRAGNYVDLKPGFNANSNSSSSYFHAFIHNCDIVGNSFRIISTTNSTPDNNTSNYKKNKDVLGFNVYPNPSDGTFIIDIENAIFNKENSIEIIDMYGRKIFIKNEVKLNDNINTDLKNGIYLMKYLNGKTTYSQKIIINK